MHTRIFPHRKIAHLVFRLKLNVQFSDEENSSCACGLCATILVCKYPNVQVSLCASNRMGKILCASFRCSSTQCAFLLAPIKDIRGQLLDRKIEPREEKVEISQVRVHFDEISNLSRGNFKTYGLLKALCLVMIHLLRGEAFLSISARVQKSNMDIGAISILGSLNYCDI